MEASRYAVALVKKQNGLAGETANKASTPVSMK